MHRKNSKSRVATNEWATWLVIGITLVASVTIGGTTLHRHGVGGYQAAMEPPPEAAGVIVIEMQDMRFIPDVIEVKPAEEVTLRLINRDDMAHDLKVNNVVSGRIPPGESKDLNIGAIETDTQGWCTIAGHRSQGMVLNFKVATPPANQH